MIFAIDLLVEVLSLETVCFRINVVFIFIVVTAFPWDNLVVKYFSLFWAALLWLRMCASVRLILNIRWLTFLRLFLFNDVWLSLSMIEFLLRPIRIFSKLVNFLVSCLDYWCLSLLLIPCRAPIYSSTFFSSLYTTHWLKLFKHRWDSSLFS